MDNDGEADDRGAAAMPKTAPFEPAKATSVSSLVPTTTEATVAADSSDKGGVFRRLVGGDSDIAGLVAYSIYKQNKLDWLRAFEATKGRTPDEAELASYIIGEGTPRRLATYRHLAEATLNGSGPDVDGTSGTTRRPFARRIGGGGTSLSASVLATYGLIVVLFIILFWFAAHFTMSSR